MRLTRLLPRALATLALGLGLLAALPLFSASPGQSSPGPDLAPLYLGARALWLDLDPVDRGVQAAMWRRYGSGLRPGAFFMPYPVSAAVLAMPLCYRSWSALFPIWWAFSGLCLVLGGLAASLWAPRAAAPPPLPARLVAAGLSVVAVCGLDVCRHALELGQVNPLMVLILSLAGGLVASGRDRSAGALIGLGAAIKLLPALLLLAALSQRRWRVLASAAATGLLLAGLTLVIHPEWSPLADLGRAWEQATIGQATEHPPLGGAWRYRGLLAGALSLGALGWLGSRRRDATARGAAVGLVLALIAVETGGMSPPHEVLLVAPALVALCGALAASGWRALPFAAGAALLTWTPLDHYPQADRFSQDHALSLLALVFAAALLRVIQVGRRPGSTHHRVDSDRPPTHPSHPGLPTRR